MQSFLNLKPRVLRELVIVGSIPPPLGGTTVLCARMLNGMKGLGVSYIHLDPRSLGVAGLFKFALKRRRCVFMINVSTSQLLRAGIVSLILRVLGHRIVWRFFGGSLDLAIADISAADRILFRAGMMVSSRIFVETKMLTTKLRISLGRAVRIGWLPNTRSGVVSVTSCRVDRPSSLQVCYVGRVSDEKGVLDLIAAINHLKGRANLHIYGPVEDTFAPQLSEAIASSPFSELHGTLSPDCVLSVIAQYDCLALPTRWVGEGYPGVILEAFVAGIPVTASNWRSIPELFIGREALLFNPSDSGGLAAILESMLDDQFDRSAVIQSQERCLRLLDEDRWNRATARYLAVVQGSS